MATQSQICCIGCGICGVLIGLIIVLVSIATIEPIEYGLVYNSISKKVDANTVYAGGWYFLGPFSSFVTFPATLVNIDWTDYPDAQYKPLQVRDNAQQDIIFSFSVQYKLQFENIGKLQDQYQTGYQAKYASFIESVVRSVVGQFSGTAFWTDRKNSGEILRQKCNERLNREYANVTNLQIINVQLSDKRESSLIDTQVTKQQGKTKIKEQQAKEIRSSISVVQSESEKNITQVQGNATAQSKLINANAQSNATQMTITATANAYKQIGDQVGITPASGLDKFIYYSDLQTADTSQVLYHIDRAMLKF